jgi:hypothetical protein
VRIKNYSGSCLPGCTTADVASNVHITTIYFLHSNEEPHIFPLNVREAIVMNLIPFDISLGGLQTPFFAHRPSVVDDRSRSGHLAFVRILVTSVHETFHRCATRWLSAVQTHTRRHYSEAEAGQK